MDKFEDEEIKDIKEGLYKYIFEEFINKEFSTLNINFITKSICFSSIDEDYLLICFFFKLFYNKEVFKFIDNYEYNNNNLEIALLINDEPIIINIEIIIKYKFIKFLVKEISNNDEIITVSISNIHEIIINKALNINENNTDKELNVDGNNIITGIETLVELVNNIILESKNKMEEKHD